MILKDIFVHREVMMLIFDELIESEVSLPQGALLLNIETTGLSPRNAFIYMIGLGWQEEKAIHTCCLLADNRMDERRLITRFYEYLRPCHSVITCGGQGFLERFMESRWTNYADSIKTDSSCSASDLEAALFEGKILIDIQKELAPCREWLGLPDIKKRTLEDFLGFSRRSPHTGKELIAIYTQWERSRQETLLQQLTTHHRDDMAALLALLRLRAYTELKKGHFKDILDWQLSDGICTFHIQLKQPVPLAIHFETKDTDITLDGPEGYVSIPVYEGRLKYFLPGPIRDYYYLPQEDMAVHRSVALYVDKGHRQKATAATCYIHKEGLFLPSPNKELQPHFQTEYQDKKYYILYDPQEWAKDKHFLISWLTAWIQMPH